MDQIHEQFKSILEKLGARGHEVPMEGLLEVEGLLSDLDDQSFFKALDAISGMFYIDPYDRPDLRPLVDKASQIIAAQGERALDWLTQMLTGTDMKFEFNVACTLGQMGAPAVGKLIQAFENTDDPETRSFIVYALGKIKDPAVANAVTTLLQAAGDSYREIRDGAVRSIGKIIEVVPPEKISSHERRLIVDALFRSVGDRVPAIRAKALRSLAKMAAAGYLGEERKSELRERAQRILGMDEQFNWDNAYIVRKEAEFALEQLGAR